MSIKEDRFKNARVSAAEQVDIESPVRGARAMALRLISAVGRRLPERNFAP